MPSISSGNAPLDQLLGGGFEQHKTTIFVGEPGNGKTTLALQFIVNPSYYHTPCAYVCIDKKPERLVENALAMNHTVQDQINAQTLTFLEVSLHGWAPSDTISDLLRTIQSQLEALVQHTPVSHVIVDSLLPSVLYSARLDQKQYFIREFLALIATFNATTIGILYDASICQTLWLDSHMIHDQLLFHRTSNLDYTTYWVEISKNNRQNLTGHYRFTFDGNHGICLKHRIC